MEKKYKYVVTGATSFIGVALCKQLLREGQEVVAVCRKDSVHLCDLKEYARMLQIVYFDLEHINTIVNNVSQADIFIHLAWKGTDHFGRDDYKIQYDNVVYAMEAIHIANILKCKLFVEAGSQAEYGFIDSIISENSPCSPETEYGKSKLQVSKKGRSLCKDLGMNYIHLRLFSIFGEEDHPWTLVMSSIAKMLRNEPIAVSSCTQNWNFLYVLDAARLICELCIYTLSQNECSQSIYNIASLDTRPLKSFIEEMVKLTRTKSEIQYGAIVPTTKVSLNPSMEKVLGVVKIDFTPFSEVINKIILKYKNRTDD